MDATPFVKGHEGYRKAIDAEGAYLMVQGFKEDLQHTLNLFRTKGFTYNLPYQFRVHRPTPLPACLPEEESSDYEDESSDYEDQLGTEDVKLVIESRSMLKFAKFKLYEITPEAEAYLRKLFVCRSEEFKLYVIW